PNSLSICIAGAGGTNQCSTCMNDSTICTQAGVGTTCNGGVCNCTSSADCTRPEAPYCLSAGSWGYTCGCFSSNNWPGACGYGKVCTGRGGTDYWSACKTMTGFPCGAASECASGFCSAGNCL